MWITTDEAYLAIGILRCSSDASSEKTMVSGIRRVTEPIRFLQVCDLRRDADAAGRHTSQHHGCPLATQYMVTSGKRNIPTVLPGSVSFLCHEFSSSQIIEWLRLFNCIFEIFRAECTENARPQLDDVDGAQSNTVLNRPLGPGGPGPGSCAALLPQASHYSCTYFRWGFGLPEFKNKTNFGNCENT